MAKPEKKSPFPSPAPPFCRQHKEMGTGVLETLKHGSTPPPPRLAPPGCRHPWELWFGSASPHSLITRVGWPWSSGNGGAGLRDGTVFPHCSALPGVNPGLVSLADIGCSQGKRGPLAGFGLPGRFPKWNRGGCCWQTLPKTAGWGLSVPKAQHSPRDPHFGILPVTRRRCCPSQPRSPGLPTPPTRPSIAVRNNTGKKPPFGVKTSKERFLDSGWVRFGGMC